jgi:hypothetical protein
MMMAMNREPTKAKCLSCGQYANVTHWRPSDGLNPSMRQFSCPNCDTEFYVVPGLEPLKRWPKKALK